jgi:hypothetical protein
MVVAGARHAGQRKALAVEGRAGGDVDRARDRVRILIRQFGLLLSGSYSMTHRRPDNVENTWSQTPAGLRGARHAGQRKALAVEGRAGGDVDRARDRVRILIGSACCSRAAIR